VGALAPASYIVFGSRLLQQLLRWKEENVLVSPASVGFALSMAAAAGGHESIDLRVLYAGLSLRGWRSSLAPEHLRDHGAR